MTSGTTIYTAQEIITMNLRQPSAEAVAVRDDKTYLCAAEHEQVAEALIKHGQEVITLLYDVVSMWGGSFRCPHHPLVRESELD